MKMRNGFVSNSSSSSFIIAFPKKPETKEDIKSMVFGGNEAFSSPWSYMEESFQTNEASEFLLNSLSFNRRKVICDLLDEYASEISYAIHNIAEYADEDCNVFLGVQGVSLEDHSRTYIQNLVADLSRFDGSVDWRKMADEEIEYERIHINKVRALEEKEIKLTRSLEKKHGLDNFKCLWENDFKKMTRLAVAQYHKAKRDYDQKYKKFVEDNKEIKAIAMQLGELGGIYGRRSERMGVAKVMAKAKTRMFLKNNENKVLTIVELSDNEGSMQAAMEHGNIFNTLSHERFSHH